MIYSLSEIDATCKKAARGAGLSWGYAEETGKVARWLAAHQLPSTALLAFYLTERQKNTDYYQGSNLRCPLLKGAGLCDAAHGEMDQPIEIGYVVYPLLLLPYLSQLSEATGVKLRVQWRGTNLSCVEGVIYIEENKSIATSDLTEVSCSRLASDFDMGKSLIQERGTLGQFVEASHWSALESLAHLTYVPATEESRRGAGPAD